MKLNKSAIVDVAQFNVKEWFVETKLGQGYFPGMPEINNKKLKFSLKIIV